MDAKKALRKLWYFIWEDNSILSWALNIVLAFVIIKFIAYPGLGLLLGTTHPIVAVVTGSMEHEEPFEKWWQANSGYYEGIGIEKEDFENFPLKDGFNRGDIIILIGANPEKLKAGDIIVFRSKRPDPIIHRIISVSKKSEYSFTTKGDHNRAPIRDYTLDEHNIRENTVIGKTLVRIPMLGYIKIWFVELLRLAGVAR